MIIGEEREAVIANIAAAATAGHFHDKVELHDPVLTSAQKAEIVKGFLAGMEKPSVRWKTYFARLLAGGATRLANRETEIVGLEKLNGISGGAIVTCNHFSPLDNTVIRLMAEKMGRRRLNIISQPENFAMGGTVGFLMNYADTIPLWTEPGYLGKTLPTLLETRIHRGELVLIYPEQEMWFHYRKPRPLLRGAHHFAARLNCPVICCFVEMRDGTKQQTPQFREVHHVLHILDVLYPDPAKTVRENSLLLCRMDEQLKRQAYEQIYGKPLHYDFQPEDIAGWTGGVAT